MRSSMLMRCGTCSDSRTSDERGRARADRPAAARCRSRARSCVFGRGGRSAGRRGPALRAVVLVRIGSRGSRLALTQAGLAAERLRRPGVEIALVPITTAGDRDRTKPFGEIGSRGVFVKELEEALLARTDRRRGAFGEGHDVDRCRRTRGRRVSRARGPARRALRRRRLAAGNAHRHGVGAPASAAARARARAVDRAAAREHRHAACASEASAGSTLSCLPPAVSTGWASPPRSTCASIPTSCCPEAGQGALALQVRVGEEELVAAAGSRRDAASRRGRAAVRRCRRRRLSRAGGRVPRRRHPDRARSCRGRILDAPRDGRRSGGARPRARVARRGRVSS